jgi:hypothetical protein
MLIKNFVVTKLDNTRGALDLAKRLWATNKDFIPSDDYWLATFEIDGVKHQAGIRRGRRIDVADDISQIDVQLRVPEESFDADAFMPETEANEIVVAVGAEFLNGKYV